MPQFRDMPEFTGMPLVPRDAGVQQHAQVQRAVVIVYL
jgi:hypothetical protein